MQHSQGGYNSLRADGIPEPPTDRLFATIDTANINYKVALLSSSIFSCKIIFSTTKEQKISSKETQRSGNKIVRIISVLKRAVRVTPPTEPCH